MLATFSIQNQTYTVDLNQPIDLSIGFDPKEGPLAWWVKHMKAEPVRMGEWIGEVRQGGSVNFFNLLLNPHGQGTHTECVGHITPNRENVNDQIKGQWFTALLVSVEEENSPFSLESVPLPDDEWRYQALLVRTLPNDSSKKNREYSGSNPPCFFPKALKKFADAGVQHFLTDLPSVDPEEDGGTLLAHRAFFFDGKEIRLGNTITELIYASNEIPDGRYLLNLQLAPISSDAVPSRPLLYTLVP